MCWHHDRYHQRYDRSRSQSAVRAQEEQQQHQMQEQEPGYSFIYGWWSNGLGTSIITGPNSHPVSPITSSAIPAPAASPQMMDEKNMHLLPAFDPASPVPIYLQQQQQPAVYGTTNARTAGLGKTAAPVRRQGAQEPGSKAVAAFFGVAGFGFSCISLGLLAGGR